MSKSLMHGFRKEDKSIRTTRTIKKSNIPRDGGRKQNCS